MDRRGWQLPVPTDGRGRGFGDRRGPQHALGLRHGCGNRWDLETLYIHLRAPDTPGRVGARAQSRHG